MTWILTSTGRRVDFADPQPDTIDIIDIANGLSKQCRFSGQCRAKAIGITKSYLWQLEKDKACPSLLIARKIADTYGISIVSMAALIPDGE